MMHPSTALAYRMDFGSSTETPNADVGSLAQHQASYYKLGSQS